MAPRRRRERPGPRWPAPSIALGACLTALLCGCVSLAPLTERSDAGPPALDDAGMDAGLDPTIDGGDPGADGDAPSPSPIDAGLDTPFDAPLDTPFDVPASACPAVAGSYPLTRIGVGCTGFTGTNLVLSGPASPMDCSFEVRLDARVVGVVANVSGTNFSGVLAVPGEPASCSLAFSPDLTRVEATCSSCDFSAGL